MEHILQFGINIDDDRIKNTIYESAEHKIMANIINDVRCQIFELDRWSGKPTGELRPVVKNMIDAILESSRGEIIEMTATKLADRISKTKKFREAVDGMIEDAKKGE